MVTHWHVKTLHCWNVDVKLIDIKDKNRFLLKCVTKTNHLVWLSSAFIMNAQSSRCQTYRCNTEAEGCSCHTGSHMRLLAPTCPSSGQFLYYFFLNRRSSDPPAFPDIRVRLQHLSTEQPTTTCAACVSIATASPPLICYPEGTREHVYSRSPIIMQSLLPLLACCNYIFRYESQDSQISKPWGQRPHRDM